ncbi:MAG: DUF1566 domain-containing protein [Nitrospirae bacterium]|nr:DUF1566 domain-containing protein [Nitrospirota bacterium]
MKLSMTVFVVLILSLSLCYGFEKKSELIVDKEGILTDTGTGLQWYEGPDKETNWDQANSWVANLTVGGGGWRMPTRAELRGLYAAGMRKRCFVWSGEVNGPFGAWGFGFTGGGEYDDTRDSDGRAFAVRSRR